MGSYGIKASRTELNLAASQAIIVYEQINIDWCLDNMYTHFSIVSAKDNATSIHILPKRIATEMLSQ